MPGLGLPQNLENHISLLMNECGLSSWKICGQGNRNTTTVVLRFDSTQTEQNTTSFRRKPASQVRRDFERQQRFRNQQQNRTQDGQAESVPPTGFNLPECPTTTETVVKDTFSEHNTDLQGPELPRPEKNYNVFVREGGKFASPQELFEGKLGVLPLLLAVEVGYLEGSDPFLAPFESEEVLFAYEEGVQERVLLHDSCHRTLSLPLHSSLTFHLLQYEEDEELTLSQIVERGVQCPTQLAVGGGNRVRFLVNKSRVDHTYFGTLTMVKVYEERFYTCLAVDGTGQISNAPTVLPENLLDVVFGQVTGILGAVDPVAKLQEVIAQFSRFARKLNYSGDPFFQEMAIISRGPGLVKNIKPYIEEKTFISIRHLPLKPPAPPPPQDDDHPPTFPPPPPPRPDKQERKSSSLKTYCHLVDFKDDDHIYDLPNHSPKVSYETYPDSASVSSASAEDSFSAEYLEPRALKLPTRSETMTSKSQRDVRHSFDIVSEIGVTRKKSSVITQFGEARKTKGDGLVAGMMKRDVEAENDVAGSEHYVKTENDVAGKNDIKCMLDVMTVDEVADKMRELGLGKVVKKFRKNHIDGVLLQKLPEGTLKAEFRLTHLEFLRLSTFVTEGHLPNTASVRRK